MSNILCDVMEVTCPNCGTQTRLLSRKDGVQDIETEAPRAKYLRYWRDYSMECGCCALEMSASAAKVVRVYEFK